MPNNQKLCPLYKAAIIARLNPLDPSEYYGSLWSVIISCDSQACGMYHHCNPDAVKMSGEVRIAEVVPGL